MSTADLLPYAMAVAGPLLGLHPTAASIVGRVGVFNAVFRHANLATPRWLSRLVQRPEADSMHHARDVHAASADGRPAGG